jgi:phosphoribosylamine--glycine ligase
MNVLVIGSGGREHALCWKLSQSGLLDQLYCAPGNPGTAQVASNVALEVGDPAAVIGFCQRAQIELVVVGPEQPLIDGLADALCAAGILCFGPSAAAARLEGSKGFTKDLCARVGIPTAAYARFTEAVAAKTYITAQGAPIVVKYDGLAAGKGVVVAATVEEAHAAVDALLGTPGDALVVEAFLAGEEASFFVLSDGTNVLPLATAQDHKRVGDGDTGPNTGGMGAYSPAPVMTPTLIEQALARIVRPTIQAMADAGTPYVGVLYAGLMITADGPQLIEYNCRFGDPEAQVLMLRLKSDLLPALLAACSGGLKHFDLRWHDDVALTVVMAADGYPGPPRKGTVIAGLEAAATVEGVEIFHAGTAREDGQLVANGGRVLNVCATAPTVEQARARAYAAIDHIRWPEGFCRRDIGWRALSR